MQQPGRRSRRTATSRSVGVASKSSARPGSTAPTWPGRTGTSRPRIGQAVEAEQEGRGRRVARPSDQPVVELGEEHLAGRRDRDDRLHRGVVLGAGVEQLDNAGEQLRGRQLIKVLRSASARPPRDSADGRSSASGPPRPAGRRPAGTGTPRRCAASAGSCPARLYAVVGVAVDGGQITSLSRITASPISSVNSACSDRVTLPSIRSANSGVSGSGSCSTMLARTYIAVGRARSSRSADRPRAAAAR